MMKIEKLIKIFIIFSLISIGVLGVDIVLDCIELNNTEVKYQTYYVEEILTNKEKIEYDNLISHYEFLLEQKEEEINTLKKEIYSYQQEAKIFKTKNSLSEKEWEYLYRVAAAEAGPDSKEGQTNVVCVVLNRVLNENFKQNNICDVITSPGQFQVYPYMFYNVEITDTIKENVFNAVLNYEKYNAYGALYFNKSNKFANYHSLFYDEVGHHFYK